MKCRKKSGLEGALNILNTTQNQARFNNAIVCCGVRQNNSLRSDGANSRGKSENGFTVKLAKKFVAGIVQAIVFGEKDSVIQVQLRAANLSSVGAGQFVRPLSQSPHHVALNPCLGSSNGVAPRMMRDTSPNPSGSLGSVGKAIELLPGTSMSAV